MKIGIDCRLWAETGVGRYVRNLVRQLQLIDNKNEYVLFVLSKNYEYVKSKITNSKWTLVDSDIRWHSAAEQLEFPRILNRENLDLVHFPYQSVPFFYNRPFVITIHDLIPYHYPTSKASALPFLLYYLKFLGYKFVISQAAKKAKKIITVSNATKDEIVDHLKVNSEKIEITYEGIDPAMLNLKVKSQNSKFQAKSKKYFLYVGNAYPHKNLERLLEAFNMLIDTNISLVLVGKDDYFYKRLKKKVKEMKLSDRVIFLENVADEELSNLYKNALALIAPSFMEGFGLPVLEAMANNCLVLASNIPALREACEDAAIYFDPYDKEDIEEKMREVYFNDLNHFSKRIKMGLERVKLFSWEKMAKETLEVYESCFSL